MGRHDAQDPAEGTVPQTPTASEARQRPGVSTLTTDREGDNAPFSPSEAVAPLTQDSGDAQPAGLVGEAAESAGNTEPLAVDDVRLPLILARCHPLSDIDAKTG